MHTLYIIPLKFHYPKHFSGIHTNNLLYIPIVSGDTNFHMKKTALTVGGFTQPNAAKSLIESPQAIEKGLVQRFLWLFPYSDFASLQKANQNFVEYLRRYVHFTVMPKDTYFCCYIW